MILIIDNYDSFTLNLAEYFHRLGKKTMVIRNDVPISNHPQHIDAVVLSPGPQLPKDANLLFEIIEHYAFNVPLLGICLGHQAINEFFGGDLKKLDQPKHGKSSNIFHDEAGIYTGIPSPQSVIRYHSWGIASLAPNFDVTATSEDDQSIMSIQHSEAKITGIQFHPESILTTRGIDFLKNWLTMCGIS